MDKPVNHYLFELRNTLAFEQPRANRDMDMASISVTLKGKVASNV